MAAPETVRDGWAEIDRDTKKRLLKPAPMRTRERENEVDAAIFAVVIQIAFVTFLIVAGITWLVDWLQHQGFFAS